MKIEKTNLAGVSLILPEPFATGRGEFSLDSRGGFVEKYNEAKYKEHGLDIHFVEDDISISQKNVLRGIHGNGETWKLVSVLHGCAFFVVVNCDKSSSTFGQWQGFDLTDSNYTLVLVPPLHGSAYLALTDKLVFHYKQSTYYSPQTQFSYRWNEPRFGITWPSENPILSSRDANAAYLDENTTR